MTTLLKRIPIENWELYNMEDDRTETIDLAAKHDEILRRLVTQWERWIGGNS